MKTESLLSQFRTAGIELWVDQGKLKYRAPKGSMTEEKLILMKEHKDELLELLRTSNGGAMIHSPGEAFESFALTNSQSAYLVGRQQAYAGGDKACHIYFELAFPELDVERLQGAWNSLVKRHAMLRAVFSEQGTQKILATVPEYQIRVADLRKEPRSRANKILSDMKGLLSHQKLDPSVFPLFDIQVSRLPDKDILHFSLDLLIADALSVSILTREWGHLYYTPEVPLPALSLSFRDVLVHQSALTDSKRAKAREYWANRLLDLPIAPQLPIRETTEASETTFARRTFLLTSEQYGTLQTLAAQVGITATSAILTAYASVIARWSKFPEFTLNMTLLNRPEVHEQVGLLVGDFTSVNLLEVRSQKQPAFVDLARQLQRQIWSDLEYRDFSGVQVMRELRRIKGEHAALMPVVFTSTLGMDEGLGVTSLLTKGELLYAITQTPQVWLDCQAMSVNGQLQINWDALESAFPSGRSTGRDVFTAFQEVLKRLSAKEEAWSETILFPLPEDMEEKRREANATEYEFIPECLRSGFDRQVTAHPNQTVVFDGRGAQLTYKDLRQKAMGVSRNLMALGVKPTSAVAIIMEKGWEQVAAALASSYSGVNFIPVESDSPIERQKYLLETANIRCILTQSWLEKHIDAIQADIPVIAVDLVAIAESVAFKAADPTAVAYTIFTSGSTGYPKGVVLSHQSVVNTLQSINHKYKISPDDSILAVSNLNFDLAIYDIFGVLSAGATLILPQHGRRRNPSHWGELVEKFGITVWNSVPVLLQMLLEYKQSVPETQISSLRLAMLSGDWIPLNLPGLCEQICPSLTLHSLGGATEAAIWSISYPITSVEPHWTSIPYGKPLPNQKFYVLGEDLEQKPDWVIGELYIGGVGLAEGYLGDEQKTNASFIIHPQTKERLYRAGDLGRYMRDGNIEFLGREDFQVKIRGHRVEIGEIEACLNKYPGISRAVVSAIGEPRGNKQLAAYLVPRAASCHEGRQDLLLAPAQAECDAIAVEGELPGINALTVNLETAALYAMLRTLRETKLLRQDSPITFEQIMNSGS